MIFDLMDSLCLCPFWLGGYRSVLPIFVVFSHEFAYRFAKILTGVIGLGLLDPIGSTKLVSKCLLG